MSEWTLDDVTFDPPVEDLEVCEVCGCECDSLDGGMCETCAAADEAREDEISELESELDELQNDLAELVKAAAEKRQEIRRLKKRIATLEA